MTMMTFLKQRRSVREFENKALGPDEISNIKNAIAEIGKGFEEAEVSLELQLDSESIFKELDGKAGYAGVMIKAPAYITLQYGKRDLMSYLKGAFALAEMETRILDFNLGSCIVTLGENVAESKKVLFGDGGENIDYIFALGFPKARPPFNPEATSFRKAVEEIAFIDEKFTKPASGKLAEFNMLDLFSALRFAPSYKNKQPWRFLVADSGIYAYVVNDEDIEHAMTDMGIVMYYFQEMAKRMGIRNNWEIVSELDESEDYIKLGRYKI